METTTLKAKAQNYRPGSMSFADGFLGPKGDVGFFMIADMDKAKEIVNELLKQGKDILDVEMGLDGDWGVNSECIWSNGKFFDYDAYNNSCWAAPIIIVNYADGSNEAYDTWKKGDDTGGNIKVRG